MASMMLVLLRRVAGLVAAVATLAAMLASVLGSSQVAIVITFGVIFGVFAVARFASISLAVVQQDVELPHEGEVQGSRCSNLDERLASEVELPETAPIPCEPCSISHNNSAEVDLQQVFLVSDEDRGGDLPNQNIMYRIQLWYADTLVHEWHGEDYTCDTCSRQTGIWNGTLSEDKATLSLWGPQGGPQSISVPELIEGHLLGAGCPEPPATLTSGGKRRQRRRQRAEWLLKREAEMGEAEDQLINKVEPEPIFIDNKIANKIVDDWVSRQSAPEPIFIDNKIENKIADKDAHIKKLPSPCRRNAHPRIAEI
mmetsp:Transcript_105968/g.187666  ORF Transcript_105968/g.187666 Transcript_105968/m.187666 type:complete len:312 (+) Transcript_105968:93-1028(+)